MDSLDAAEVAGEHVGVDFAPAFEEGFRLGFDFGGRTDDAWGEGARSAPERLGSGRCLTF
jgi:hypothetical protein